MDEYRRNTIYNHIILITEQDYRRLGAIPQALMSYHRIDQDLSKPLPQLEIDNNNVLPYLTHAESQTLMNSFKPQTLYDMLKALIMHRISPYSRVELHSPHPLNMAVLIIKALPLTLRPMNVSTSGDAVTPPESLWAITSYNSPRAKAEAFNVGDSAVSHGLCNTVYTSIGKAEYAMESFDQSYIHLEKILSPSYAANYALHEYNAVTQCNPHTMMWIAQQYLSLGFKGEAERWLREALDKKLLE